MTTTRSRARVYYKESWCKTKKVACEELKAEDEPLRGEESALKDNGFCPSLRGKVGNFNFSRLFEFMKDLDPDIRSE